MANPAIGETTVGQTAAPVTPLPAAQAPPPKPRRQWGRALLRFLLLVAVPVAGAWVGAHYWVLGGRYVETDNAYIRADKVAIGAEVPGKVIEVLVSSNQVVVAGDLLFRLDDQPYRIKLAQSEAQLHMVRTEIAVLRAKYWQAHEEVVLAETRAAYLEQEYRRQQQLGERNVAAAVKVDEARHAFDVALQSVTVRERELGEISARLGGNPQTPDESFARFIAARTKRDQDILDLNNTVVQAPADGIIGRVDLRPGTIVDPGRPMISLVETADLWFEANLKESQLTHVREGQPATVRVDAYPDHLWQARVASFSPATGAEFAVLPSQNATGNWVKVVQRVPVRLRIDRDPADPPLRVGMSAVISIDTGYERPTPEIVLRALAWLPSFEGLGLE